jgi:hypothetical protein
MKISQFHKIITTDFLFNLLFFYTATVLFVTPHESFPHAKVFVPILTVVLFIKFVSNGITISQKDLVLILCILLTILLNISIDKTLCAFFMILLLVLCRQPKYLNKKFAIFMYIYILAGATFWFLFSYTLSGEISLSNGDPNHSGYLLLLFIFFCYKNDFKIGIFLSSILVFFLGSRSYLISLIIFFGFVILEKFFPKISNYINSFFDKNKFINWSIIMIASNCLILVYSTYFVSQIEIANISRSFDFQELIQRTIIFNDRSNYLRFHANTVFFEIMSNNVDIALFGLPDQSEEYIKSLFPVMVLHNSVFILMICQGIIFCFFYFFAFGRIVKRLGDNNLKYILSSLVFPLVYWGAFQSVFLALFVIVLALPTVRQSKKKGHFIPFSKTALVKFGKQ